MYKTGILFQHGMTGSFMKIADEIGELLSGEELVWDFSTNGLMFLIVLSGVSVLSGVTSRIVLFPRLMDLFSKTERIDGRTLFAPRSLGWMVGLLLMWQSVDWTLDNVSVSNGNFIWNHEWMENVAEASRAGFVILMLVAAYRLVDLSLIHI